MPNRRVLLVSIGLALTTGMTAAPFVAEAAGKAVRGGAAMSTRPAGGGGAARANAGGARANAGNLNSGGNRAAVNTGGNRTVNGGNRAVANNSGNRAAVNSGNRGNNNNINSGNSYNRNVNVNVDNDHGWGWDDNYHPVARGVAFGAAAAVTAAAVGSMMYTLPPSCPPYPYAGRTYYSCGGVYYEPQYQGDQVVYVVVNNPG